MKKLIAILLVLSMLVCVFAACSDDEEIVDQTPYVDLLQTYLLQEDGKVVTADFELPGKIGTEEATWTSDNSALVLTEKTREKVNENGETVNERYYVASIVRPETEQTVTLTVTIGQTSKTFTVRVEPVSVYDFSGSYVFAKDKATVYTGFDLDTTCTFEGKTATIKWSVDAEYAEYLAISEDGKSCVVYPNSMNPTVKINATFTYNNESTTKAYRMTVSQQKSHMEEIDYWYNNTGVSMDMKGYVVAIGTEYSADYGNVTLYMVDDNFRAGYYLYRVKLSPENAAKLVPGVHVTVTGTTNTNYNGLVETNAGGNLVVDDNIEKINVADHVYKFDEDLLGNVPAAIYLTSALVSLDKWTVESIYEKAPETGKTATLFYLTKNGVKISVAVSKYLEGAYKTAEGDATWEALCNLQTTLKVGDVVSITGILGNYKGFQLMPLSADAVVKEAAPEDPATVHPGIAVGEAVKAINKIIADNDLTKTLKDAKEVTFPAKVGDVTITYKLCSTSNAVTLADGKLTVNPGKAEKVNVEITYTNGDYSTVQFLSVTSDKNATDENPEEPEVKDFITVSAALEMTKNFAEGDVTADVVTVKGVVKSIGETGTFYKNVIITEGDKELLIYTINLGEGITGFEVGDTIYAKGYIKNDKGTIEMASNNNVYVYAIKVEKGSAPVTPEDPTTPVVPEGVISVSEALDLAKDFADGDVTADVVTVAGVVKSIGETGTFYKNVIITEGDKELLIYTINLGEGITGFEVGDTIYAKGYIKNYKGTIEMASNNNVYVYAIKVEKGSAPVTPEDPTPAAPESKVYTIDDFTKELPERFTGDGVIHIPASVVEENTDVQAKTENKQYRLYAKEGVAADVPSAGGVTKLIESGVYHYYLDPGVTKEYQYFRIVVEVPEEGEYDLAMHLRLKKTSDGGSAARILNLVIDDHEMITLSYEELAAVDAVLTEANGSYLSGWSVYLTQGKHVFTFTLPEKKSSLHFRDFYFVKVGGSSEPTPEDPTTPVTPEEIVNAAYALEKGTALEGSYTLTGVISGISTPYSAQNNNISVVMIVNGMTDKPITCYRLTGTGIDTLKETDTITVTGSLKNYNGTIEFDANCTLDALVPGEGIAEPSIGDVEGNNKLAAVVDFTAQGYANATEVTPITIEGFTVTFDKGTSKNAAKFYTSGNAVRVYGGNTMTITGGEQTITKIVITFGTSDGSNEITVDAGTLTGGEWIGENTSVLFTIGGTSGNRRIAKIAIYVAA